MPVERSIRSTLADTRSVIRTMAPVEVRSQKEPLPLASTIVDAKEFSLDTANTVGSEGPYSVTCGGGKCTGPCVQRCLPLPPPPKCR